MNHYIFFGLIVLNHKRPLETNCLFNNRQNLKEVSWLINIGVYAEDGVLEYDLGPVVQN